MRITITIECDNAAFDDAPGEAIATQLSYLADELDGATALQLPAYDGRKLRDRNGNACGKVEVSDG